jgi:adenosylhomocysteine nucleosidase
MNRIALIAALPSELRPLVHHWTHHGKITTGRIGNLDAIAVAAGIGEAAVLRACEHILSAGAANAPIDTLVSVGYAGSLSCGLTAPEAVAVLEVIDARTGESFAATPSPQPPASGLKPQRLVTVDHVVNPAEKRRLAETHQATLVDMEAATVARFAQKHNLGFLCFKAITDGPNDELPDFNRFTTPDGRLRTAAFATYALFRPQYWRVLGELEKNSRAAAHQLANCVLANFASPPQPASVS